MKKSLGGDRLGSGSKLQVELHNYERSTHDLGYIWRSTMAAGTLVPFLCEVALPGDTFDIELNCDVKTHPTVGPLFGSYKVQLDLFVAPFRLYQAELHNNRLGIGMKMADVKLPIMDLDCQKFDATLVDDIDNAQINPSALFSYIGIRGVASNNSGVANVPRSFNAIPFLAYWDIYKNYYANKQEEIGAVIHTTRPTLGTVPSLVQARPNAVDAYVTLDQRPISNQQALLGGAGGAIKIGYTIGGPAPQTINVMLYASDGRAFSFYDLTYPNPLNDNSSTGIMYALYNGKYGPLTLQYWDMITPQQAPQVTPGIATFPLENIDLTKDQILMNPPGVAFKVNDFALPPYSLILGQTSGFNHMMSSQEGLGLKTYQSDLFNNWLKTEWIDGVDGISAVTKIDTSSGGFTIDTLNLSKKVYDMLNRIAVSGGSYDDWIDAVYTHTKFNRSESPVYHGGLSKELVFQEVVSKSNAIPSQGNQQPLGTLAGKGAMAQKHKGGKAVIHIDEPSYVIGIISLTPRIDYSQGNKWDVHLMTMDDLHKPALDEIGFQELITEQMAWWSTAYQAGVFATKSAGKQPAWLNYMTNVNQCRGNFAVPTNEMFMTLNRRYQKNAGTNTDIKDLTTYIDPSKFNNIFAQTSLDAQNFWAQIAVDATVRRKISARLIPNL